MEKEIKKELWMDDVHSIALEAMEFIQKRLKGYGIELNEANEDEIYIPIDNAIEKFSNGYYKGYN